MDQDQLFLSTVTMHIVPWRAGAALEGKRLIDKARANDTAAVCCYHSPSFIVVVFALLFPNEPCVAIVHQHYNNLNV